ncbi:membrane protein insertion efficiency factor YidD [Chamaesiphon polymorphus]|uniref:Membrane protein insertion efficiency factor YidD n=1 Tax=Chamaesiphon polymorphus CCALA 037 TaxID=2107692 RepID=A0A2T1GHQ7_9CYAN|nr:membrane protein insertion efficiency factor YidD [Chamaesiphon polymorphus]PSB57257.1 membrane protein insertion efficiency factor YidD [Chamaesiphon polymorphus CCALA 037]
MPRASIDSFPPRIVDSLAIAAIAGYQRYLSPYKGFRCAHRVLHRGESCSQYVKRMVREEGLGIALAKSRVRFAECKEANRILQARRKFDRLSIESGENEEPENTDADRSPNPDPTKRKRQFISNSNSSCNGNNCNNCGDCCIDVPDCSGCDTPALDCNGCDSDCGDWSNCGDCGDCSGCGDCGSCSN